MLDGVDVTHAPSRMMYLRTSSDKTSYLLSFATVLRTFQGRLGRQHQRARFPNFFNQFWPKDRG